MAPIFSLHLGQKSQAFLFLSIMRRYGRHVEEGSKRSFDGVVAAAAGVVGFTEADRFADLFDVGEVTRHRRAVSPVIDTS